MFDYPDILLMVAMMATVVAIWMVVLVRFIQRLRVPRGLKVLLITFLYCILALIVFVLATPPLGRH